MDKMFDRSIPEIRSNVSVSGSKRDSPGETEGKTPVFPKSTNLKRQKLSDNLMDGNGTATRGVAKKEISGLPNHGVQVPYPRDLPSHSHPLQDLEIAVPTPVKGLNQSTLHMRETRSRTQRYLLPIDRYSITILLGVQILKILTLATERIHPHSRLYGVRV